MEIFTYEHLTNVISLKSQEMMMQLKERNMRKAEDIADEIARTIYQYRKLSETLTNEVIL